MNILVISNLYPPHYIGGYELACRDAVEQLRERGHQVRVRTSTYGSAYSASDGETLRMLDISSLVYRFVKTFTY
jgi:glycogen synthase